ncbi:hypothetical protein JT358_03745 [Micrococcales bacterium 31B]|nr:hypothetical protein [Micrococcales bacterium 31B]
MSTKARTTLRTIALWISISALVGLEIYALATHMNPSAIITPLLVLIMVVTTISLTNPDGSFKSRERNRA